MKIELEEESQKLIEKFINQFDRLNENLEDFKEMVAPVLGFIVKKENKNVSRSKL